MRESEEEDNYQFFLRCKAMRPEFDSFWSKVFSVIETKATIKGDFSINLLET